MREPEINRSNGAHPQLPHPLAGTLVATVENQDAHQGYHQAFVQVPFQVTPNHFSKGQLMSKSVTEKIIHDLLLKALATQLKGDEVPASVMNVARQFLKDNNFEAAAGPNNPVNELAADINRHLALEDDLPTYGTSH